MKTGVDSTRVALELKQMAGRKAGREGDLERKRYDWTSMSRSKCPEARMDCSMMISRISRGMAGYSINMGVSSCGFAHVVLDIA